MLVKSPGKTSTWIRTSTGVLRTLAMLSMLCLSHGPVCATDEPAPGKKDALGIDVAVKDIRLGTGAMSQRPSMLLQLELLVSVSNRTQEPVTLPMTTFKCVANSKPTTIQPAIQDPLLPEERKIDAGDSAEGWVAFVFQQSLANEPAIELSWEIRGKLESASLNKLLRTAANVKVERFGPDNSLAVVTLGRKLDFWGMWLLNDQFRELHKQGVRRLVIDVKPPVGSESRASSFSSSSSGPVMSWLATAFFDPSRVRLTTRPGGLVSSVQFEEIFVIGLATTRTSSTSRRTSIHQPSRESAITLALRSIYEFVTVDQALLDLKNVESGIQRIALESVIDRLTSEQLSQVLQEAKSADAAYQAMIAANLYRTALPEAITALNEMVRSDTPEIVAAAMNSLVRSVSPAAATSLEKVWYESSNDIDVRQKIAAAIIDRKAYRHINLLAEFAERQLTLFSETPGAGNPATGSTRSTVDVASLKKVLGFFRAQGNLRFEETARRELLNIADPKVQDMLLDFVLNSDQTDAEQVARLYIEQRLSKKPSFTTTLLNTIRKYPDTSYTPQLLEFADSQSNSSTYRSDAFRTALRCASDEQLLEVVDAFESLDPSRKSVLLQQLSVMGHPARLSLVEKCLDDDRTVSLAATVLRSDQSPEAMQIVIRRLNALRLEAEAAAAKRPQSDKGGISMPRSSMAIRVSTADATLKQLIDLLGSRNQQYVHPDARRAMNLMRRSTVPRLAELSQESVRSAAYTIPSALITKIQAAYKLQEEGGYRESKEAFLRIVEEDPFYVHAYTALASLDLREGLGQQAMERLQIADRMNPEDVHTQSMIALAEIRLGNIARGVELAEQILESVPDLATGLRCDTLYNTACTYGRAIEVEKDAAKLETYRTRGIAHLKDCVHRENGFHDSAHILADPDLNVFHQHPEWADLIETIKKNELKAEQDAQ